MSSGAAQAWFIAGTIPLMLAGGLHAVLTMLDTVRPTSFTPTKDSVRLGMDGAGMRFRALFRLLIATHDFGLVERIGGLQAITIAVPAAYLVIYLIVAAVLSA
jgi:hypothetical protein